MRRVHFFAIPAGPYLIFLRRFRIGYIAAMKKYYHRLLRKYQTYFILGILNVLCYPIHSKGFITEFHNIQDSFCIFYFHH